MAYCQTELCRRTAAAAGASCLSVLLLTPFEVVKNRMQAQAATPIQTLAQQSFSQRLAIVGCPNMCDATAVCSSRLAALCPPECYAYLSTSDAMRKIYRQEGMRVFWRGTREGLLIAIPLVGLYLPLYDFLVERMTSLGHAAPMVAGATARSLSVFCVTPIEVLRVRLQVQSSTQQLHNFDWGQGKGALQKTRALWKGFGATVIRDVPFTAIYWGMLEPIRMAMLPKTDDRTLPELLVANSVAGASSGVVASVVTHPMDVVKTRAQIAPASTSVAQAGTSSHSSRLTHLARHIYYTEGVRGFFTGVGARTLRIGPSCAIVLSTYELLKRLL